MVFTLTINDDELPEDFEEAETDIEITLEDAGYSSASVLVVPSA